MARVKLTDRKLQSLKKAKQGERYEVMDTDAPGLGVRVNDKGRRAFIMFTRFPGQQHPARRSLGDYPAMSLAEARDKAGDWIRLISRGVDPAQHEEQQREEAAIRRANSFAAVAADFIAQKLPTERKGKEVERDLRGSFLKASWAGLPIADVTDLHVLKVINAKKAEAPAQARNLLGYVKRLFAWAVDQRVYGLKASPVESLKAARIIGRKKRGERVLSDLELTALWRAVARRPYPYGPIYRLLILGALRLNEVADAGKSEINRSEGVWVIPADRMKGREETARAHAVPLTAEVLREFEALPKFDGPFLFTTTFGEKAVWVGSKEKNRLDALMLEELQALARERGEDVPAELAEWDNHDIRRTVRSHLSRLKISEEAREAVLAHARPGIKGTYDLYDYYAEKKEALELWAARLRSIVEPAPANVIPLRAAQ
jgi:integrase